MTQDLEESLVKDGITSVLHDASDEFIIVNTAEVLVVPDPLVECFSMDDVTDKEVIEYTVKMIRPQGSGRYVILV